jgi:hypothetical protein
MDVGGLALDDAQVTAVLLRLLARTSARAWRRSATAMAFAAMAIATACGPHESKADAAAGQTAAEAIIQMDLEAATATDDGSPPVDTDIGFDSAELPPADVAIADADTIDAGSADGPDINPSDVDVMPPPDATPSDASSPDVLLDTTNTGDGNMGVPVPCEPTPCAQCPPPYACTCKGDGDHPCAWAKMAKMSLPRVGHGAVWGDGKIYVWGGAHSLWDLQVQPKGELPGPTASGEVWDPQTDTWAPLPQAPLYPASEVSMVWGDGKLYVQGSHWDEKKIAGKVQPMPWPLEDVAVFDPKTGKWAGLPKEGSPGLCAGASAMAWTGSALLLAGCKFVSGKPAAMYTPATGKWSPLPLPKGYDDVPCSPSRSAWLGKQWICLRPTEHLVFTPADSTWAALPAGATTGIAYETVVAIDGGVFIWGTPSVSTSVPKAWIRWLNPPSVVEVPLPAWLTKANHRNLAWTGKHVVVWSGGASTTDALFDPASAAWSKAPKALQSAGRLWARMIVSDLGVFAIGGEIITTPDDYVTATCGRWLAPQ